MKTILRCELFAGMFVSRRRQFLPVAAFVGILLFGVPKISRSMDVTGQVLLPQRGGAREAVLYLEGGQKSVPLAKAIVDQRDKTFLPHVSVVTVGTIVEFPNNDTVLHNVFTYYQAKKFDLGLYPRGATKHQKMDKSGIVALLCNIHSDMSAYIVVVNTPYYAVTDRRGRFQMRNVPPGNYTLHAWHESGATLTQPITVTADTPPLTLLLQRK